jgi:excisionase family DNA binding protein
MNTIPPPERRTMSVEEAAVALGIGRTTAYMAIRRGELPCLRIGRRVVVPRDAIERLLTNDMPFPPGYTSSSASEGGRSGR